MYIQAIMWYFSMTQQQAQQYYQNCIANNEKSILNEILTAYQQQARLAFYND